MDRPASEDLLEVVREPGTTRGAGRRRPIGDLAFPTSRSQPVPQVRECVEIETGIAGARLVARPEGALDESELNPKRGRGWRRATPPRAEPDRVVKGTIR